MTPLFQCPLLLPDRPVPATGAGWVPVAGPSKAPLLSAGCPPPAPRGTAASHLVSTSDKAAAPSCASPGQRRSAPLRPTGSSGRSGRGRCLQRPPSPRSDRSRPKLREAARAPAAGEKGGERREPRGRERGAGSPGRRREQPGRAARRAAASRSSGWSGRGEKKRRPRQSPARRQSLAGSEREAQCCPALPCPSPPAPRLSPRPRPRPKPT